jgi:outer membrane protein OmpA-like peptidoglycan-associated protein
MNSAHSLSVFVVVLAGCSTSPVAEQDANRYAFLDPATGITYNVPMRFNLSTGLASLSGASASAAVPLEKYVAATEGAGARRVAATNVALLSPINRPNAVQDVPMRTALVDTSQSASTPSAPTRGAVVATVEAKPMSGPAPVTAMNLKLDTEFASAKRLIRFAAGAASLGRLGKLAVAELIPWAKQAEKVHVRGGADSSGNAAQNRDLAIARATAVSTAFIAGGVDREKISKSFCNDCYVASNDTQEGRRINRRVDVELVLKRELHARLPAPVYAPKVPDSLPLIQSASLR